MSGPEAYRIFHTHMASWSQKRLAEWRLEGEVQRKTPREATEDFLNSDDDDDEEFHRKAMVLALAHRIHKNSL